MNPEGHLYGKAETDKRDAQNKTAQETLEKYQKIIAERNKDESFNEFTTDDDDSCIDSDLLEIENRKATGLRYYMDEDKLNEAKRLIIKSFQVNKKEPENKFESDKDFDDDHKEIPDEEEKICLKKMNSCSGHLSFIDKKGSMSSVQNKNEKGKRKEIEVLNSFKDFTIKDFLSSNKMNVIIGNLEGKIMRMLRKTMRFKNHLKKTIKGMDDVIDTEMPFVNDDKETSK